jgi:hypothetical protein
VGVSSGGFVVAVVDFCWWLAVYCLCGQLDQRSTTLSVPHSV